MEAKGEDADSRMYRAQHYLESALELYSEWETWGKTEQLRKKYANVLFREDQSPLNDLVIDMFG
jgi:hypothetical protein